MRCHKRFSVHMGSTHQFGSHAAGHGQTVILLQLDFLPFAAADRADCEASPQHSEGEGGQVELVLDGAFLPVANKGHKRSRNR
jgi:hypothetical protein